MGKKIEKIGKCWDRERAKIRSALICSIEDYLAVFFKFREIFSNHSLEISPILVNSGRAKPYS